jgi:hypothetical protein
MACLPYRLLARPDLIDQVVECFVRASCLWTIVRVGLLLFVFAAVIEANPAALAPARVAEFSKLFVDVLGQVRNFGRH